jgi:hypothetical protein
MKRLSTFAWVALALVLPRGAIAQERYPALNMDQLSPDQQA